MALISCAECNREISDKAASCPHCGAPRDNVSTAELAIEPQQNGSTAEVAQNKTHPLVWLTLILILCGAFWFLVHTSNQNKLPELPVSVKVRTAITGPGQVVLIQNTSDRHLTFLVKFENPTTKEAKTLRADVKPSQSTEIGHKEGWPASSGDSIKIENNDYKAWQGKVP
jgi:hypothetical protein